MLSSESPLLGSYRFRHCGKIHVATGAQRNTLLKSPCLVLCAAWATLSDTHLDTLCMTTLASQVEACLVQVFSQVQRLAVA